jgi:hypothetical protein
MDVVGSVRNMIKNGSDIIVFHNSRECHRIVLGVLKRHIWNFHILQLFPLLIIVGTRVGTYTDLVSWFQISIIKSKGAILGALRIKRFKCGFPHLSLPMKYGVILGF